MTKLDWGDRAYGKEMCVQPYSNPDPELDLNNGDRRVRGKAMTGADLQSLLIDKWGYSFDIQLRRAQGKIFLQVMWRYLEQVSFPLSEAEYLAHLDQILLYLNEWGQVDYIKQCINETRDRPRLGKAVSIALPLGDRALEWLTDEF
jgi:hypothetical protein